MKRFLSFIMKVITFLFIISGLGILAFAGYNFYEGYIQEDQATNEAEELLERTLYKKDKEKDSSNVDKEDFKETFDPQYGDSIGMLVIDKIDAELPIVQGVEEDDLKKGVGHYTGTSYPLDDDQIVLSGHRDSVFKRMSEIEVGDIMTVNMPYGSFDYKITETKVVPADDLSIIVPHDEETLTVTTCYPFSYFGNAPDRFIVDAKPIN